MKQFYYSLREDKIPEDINPAETIGAQCYSEVIKEHERSALVKLLDNFNKYVSSMGFIDHYGDDILDEDLRICEEVLRQLSLHISCILDLGLHHICPANLHICTQHV